VQDQADDHVGLILLVRFGLESRHERGIFRAGPTHGCRAIASGLKAMVAFVDFKTLFTSTLYLLQH